MKKPVDLETITNGKLSVELEARWSHLGETQHAIFKTEERTDVPFNTVLSRLADDHPARLAYVAASRAVEEALYEARYRCGPVTFSTIYPIMLRANPRGKRSKTVRRAA